MHENCVVVEVFRRFSLAVRKFGQSFHCGDPVQVLYLRGGCKQRHHRTGIDVFKFAQSWYRSTSTTLRC
jgi:hypothetical protein